MIILNSGVMVLLSKKKVFISWSSLGGTNIKWNSPLLVVLGHDVMG